MGLNYDLETWKRQAGTQDILKKIQKEIQASKDEITNGRLTISPALEREYCRAIGYLNGLQYIEELLKEESEDESQTS